MNINFEEMKNTFESVAKTTCKKTKELAKSAKLCFDIEAQKGKLSSLYEKIGKAVVTNSLGGGEKEEEIFKLIDEAKLEREKLHELYEKKKEEKID